MASLAEAIEAQPGARLPGTRRLASARARPRRGLSFRRKLKPPRAAEHDPERLARIVQFPTLNQ